MNEDEKKYENQEKLKGLIQISLFLEESEKLFLIQKISGYTDVQVENLLEVFAEAEKKQNAIIETVLEEDPEYFDEIISQGKKEMRKTAELEENKREKDILKNLENILEKI